MDKNSLQLALSNAQCHSNMVQLTEDDPQATLSEINIIDLPDNSIVKKKMDKSKVDNFFIPNREWGYNKHSDYVIITDDHIVLIEIKSRTEVKNDLEHECIQKFSSDLCLLKYADNVFDLMLGKNIFFGSKTIHYVLLYQAPSINKATTMKMEDNTAPSRFRKISVSNASTISFKKML
ncbi:hypothetical protein [Bacteroides xylanisolvens]|uniref:hypothetical protein n=1 Tax=Bacteroides xylanisolvens TaxID=371601 RepID=UPI00189BDBFE|nr:hypothetical protein [Bacteroides xylanisolvens]